MKTKELIDTLIYFIEQNGLMVNRAGDNIRVLKDGYIVANVSVVSQYSINTLRPIFNGLNLETQRELYDILNAYAITPLEEREDVKKYYLKLPGNFASNNFNVVNYNHEECNYFISDKADSAFIQTAFTDEDIDRLPDSMQDLIKVLTKEEINFD